MSQSPFFSHLILTLDFEDGRRMVELLSTECGFYQFGVLQTSELDVSDNFFCTAWPVQSYSTSYFEGGVKTSPLLFEDYKDHLIAGLLSYETGFKGDPVFSSFINDDCDSTFIGIYDWYLSYCSIAKKFSIYSLTPNQRLCEKLQGILDTNASNLTKSTFNLESCFQPDSDKTKYLEKVAIIKNHIVNGDCYQINFTQRFSAIYKGNPWLAYQHLTKINTGEYAAFINTGSKQVTSFSPEQFIAINGDKIQTKPIKGTRPTGKNVKTSQKYYEELKESTKDKAENLMIVDLLRNDLGKICETGSVNVSKLFDIESFENVHHLVSTIHGQLKKDVTPLNALLSMFPGGSITGAPKIEAMKIIYELEEFKRDAYCGSIFYLKPTGELNSSITIRTLLCDQGKIYCYGGGGIVADSIPEDEYSESVNKVKIFMERLESLNK